MATLTQKQKKWAKFYDGNLVETARKAGYGGNKSSLKQISLKNRANPKIIELLDKNVIKFENMTDKVASKEQRQQFWTKVMYDPTWNQSMRIKSSELLGKSKNDFIDKREIKTEEENKTVLIIPGVTPEQWEELFEEEFNRGDNE